MGERILHLREYLKSLGSEVYPYGNASHAFHDILKYLNNGSSGTLPNVVMPTFIPAKLYRATAAAGYEPKFYEILEGCKFNAGEIEDLVDDNTTAIFGIHYFGHPANMEQLREIADRKKVSLIEDCAHVLLGTVDGKPMGTFGDFAIFSPRKMMQLPNGGFLLSKKRLEKFVPSYRDRARMSRSFTKYVNSRFKHLYFKILSGSDPFHIVRPPKVGYFDPNRESTLYVKKMSFVTLLYDGIVNIRRNSKVRKENYCRLFEALMGLESLKPLYEDLPDEWEPYSFPMIIHLGERGKLLRMLLDRGISCGLGWPESPFENRFSRTKELSRCLIELPVHPLVLETQLDRIVQTCREYEKKCVESLAKVNN